VNAVGPSATAAVTPRPSPTALAGSCIAVVGATGFIGSHLVDALVVHGAAVIAVSQGQTWRPNVPALAAQGLVRLVVADPTMPRVSQEDLRAALSGVDGVALLAYRPAPPGSAVGRCGHEIRRNVEGLLRVLDVLPDELRRICFASSIDVYGVARPARITERMPPAPTTPYGAGKAAAESFLRAYSATSGVAATALRLATVYGPRETAPRAIPNFIRRALNGQPPEITGSSAEVRDFVSVHDVVSAVLLALADSEPGSKVYNVGSGTGTSLGALADLVRWLVAHDEPEAATVAEQVGIDVSLAEVNLGYRPHVRLADGLNEEIRWFREHPSLWASKPQDRTG
jgi:nucleoside-diphosphate-sugar epimerase